MENKLLKKIKRQLYIINNEIYKRNIRKNSSIQILKILKKSNHDYISKPRNGDKVTVHYIGKLLNGKEFDNSWSKNKPFSFTIGNGEVIPGWEKIIKKIKLGEKVKVLIPHNLAYGNKGVGSIIPPKSDLIFIIQLLKINNT